MAAWDMQRSSIVADCRLWSHVPFLPCTIFLSYGSLRALRAWVDNRDLLLPGTWQLSLKFTGQETWQRQRVNL